MHYLVFWKLGNLETQVPQVNFRIEIAMFEKSNQKKSAQREKTNSLGQNKKEQLEGGKEQKTRHYGGGVVQMFHLFCPRL